VLKSSVYPQLYESEFQTEVVLIPKAFADNIARSSE